MKEEDGKVGGMKRGPRKKRREKEKRRRRRRRSRLLTVPG
jgi:hypothetical protein